MGQQQLLLLVLGIVIVGVAVVSGIDAFDENRQKAKDDSEHLKMVDLATQIQAWKAKPAMLGGGGSTDANDFSNFTIGVLGLTNQFGPDASPIVNMPGAGCFRFFPSTNSIRINALNEACEIGSWNKGLIISGLRAEDLTWEYRYR